MYAELRENERIDDLQFKGLKLIQNGEYFSFGIDAVLLARFSSPKDNDVIVDLGTGTGIIPVMASGLCSSDDITGLEIQECMCDLFGRSIVLNSLDDRVRCVNGDIKQIGEYFARGSVSLVISNPPYIKAGNGIVNDLSQKAISRHEVLCTLDDVVSAAGYLLKEKGRLALINKPERMIECFDTMRKYGIQPKRAQLIFPRADKLPSAIMIEGVKGAKEGFKMLRPIIVMNDKGEYTVSIQDIYSDKGAEIFR